MITMFNLSRFAQVFSILILLACLAALSGCAEWAAARSSVATYGEQAADESLDLAINHLCQVATVGSIKRRFKTEQEITGYNALCKDYLPISTEQ